MPRLVDTDGKTVPVISRKMREPAPHLFNWDKYRKIGIVQGMAVWVTMTTKGQLLDASIPLYDLTQTADGWEYLVSKARLIRHLRLVTPPFRIE